MIQRLQSIFLFLASLAMFLVIFLPIWNKTLPETTEEYAVLTALDLTISKGGETVDKIQTFYIAILAFVASALAMGSLVVPMCVEPFCCWSAGPTWEV